MNLRTRFTVVLTTVVMAAGCATAPQGQNFLAATAPPPPQGKATVYVFRNSAEPTMWGSAIHFGDKEIANLSQGGFTWSHVSPGTLKIRGVWAGLSGQKDSNIDLEVAAGKTYYVELVGITRVAGYSAGGLAWNVGSGLREVPPQIAISTLTQCCKLQQPVSP